MGYYDDPKHVEEYIKMADGYDGKVLIDVLQQHLPSGKSVLELGMGPGKDLELLSAHFKVTGSDQSAAFLERYKQLHPDADLLQLDAVSMDTTRQFDGIYSNKVLYHLTRDALVESFKRQATVLKKGGIALHSFWYGDGEDSMHGLHFAYYTEATLSQIIPDLYDVVTISRYTEMETDDSLYVVLKRK